MTAVLAVEYDDQNTSQYWNTASMVNSDECLQRRRHPLTLSFTVRGAGRRCKIQKSQFAVVNS